MLRLGELPAAEDAIAQANILDNTNPLVWALSAVTCLTFGKHRIAQARFALNEAYKYGLSNTDLLEEIGDLFEKESLFADAQQAYEALIKLEPNNGTAHYKLGVVLANENNAN